MGKAPQSSKKQLTLLIVIFCISVVLGVQVALKFIQPQPKDSQGARVKGSLNAPLRITEYMDFQCPACADGSQLLSRLVEKYPEKILLQVKYYPLTTLHRHAFRSAWYAECAALQGKFWPFHDLLMQTQKQWETLISADPFFEEVAKKVELNGDQLNSCLQKEDVKGVILKEKDEGDSRGVKSTPTYFVNDKMIVGTKSLREELKAYFPEESLNAPIGISLETPPPYRLRGAQN